MRVAALAATGIEPELEPDAPAVSPARDRTDAAKADVAWVHAIRAVAIVFVVLLHVAAEAFYLGVKAGTYDWWVANVYDCATRICVPLFFMLTGHLLLGTTDSVGVFYRKRARRIVVPWLSWSLVYLFLVALYEVHHPSGTSAMTVDFLKRISEAGPWALLGMLVFPMYYHLWFLYALIWVYLLMPLWRRVVRGRTTRELWMLAAAWTVCTSVLTFARGPQQPLPVTIFAVLFYGFAGLLGFPLLGYLLGRITLSRRIFGIMTGVALIGTLATIFGTYVLTLRNGGELDSTLWGDTLNIVVTAAAVFTMVRYLVETHGTSADGRLSRILKALSETSFGVYLLHPILLYALSVGVFGLKATALSQNSLYAIPLLALFVVTVSHHAVRVLQRLPYVRTMVG
jgi:surface polysaccharide O-acyltransferase-like enzyme